MPGEYPLQGRDRSREHWVPAKAVMRDNHGQVRRLGIWDFIILVMGTPGDFRGFSDSHLFAQIEIALI